MCLDAPELLFPATLRALGNVGADQQAEVTGWTRKRWILSAKNYGLDEESAHTSTNGAWASGPGSVEKVYPSEPRAEC
jgi:hypothetical protein